MIIKKSNSKILLWSLFSFLLTSCSAFNRIKQEEITTRNNLQNGQQMLSLLRHQQNSSVNVHQEGFWVDKQAIAINKSAVLKPCDITLFEARKISLSQFANKVRAICGVSVSISNDLLASNNTSTSSNNSTVIGDRNNSLPALDNDAKVTVQWQGPLSGLLDSVASQLDGYWRYDNNRIQFAKYETRTFQISALPSTDTLSTSVANTQTISTGDSGGGSTVVGMANVKSSSGTTTGSTNQSLASQLNSSVFDDISKTVASMLTANGKSSLSLSTASLTVTDSPSVIAEVARYIDRQNSLLSTQILLNVQVLNVTLNDEDRYGINWNLIYQNAIGFSLTGGTTNTDGSTAGIQVLRGPFDKSKLLINALSKQGNVSVVTQPSATTLNLQAVPMQVTTTTNYLASTQVTTVPQVGTTTTATPSKVTTGFNMLLLPYAMADHKVFLQFNIDFSDLSALTTQSVSSGSNSTTIQLPTVDMRAFSQKVKLLSGETLVLSGFEQNDNSTTLSGVGSAHNQLLGGDRLGKKQHSIIVILITPTVMN